MLFVRRYFAIYRYITTVETDAVICIPLKGGEEDCADCKYIACTREETFFVTLVFSLICSTVKPRPADF